MLHTNHDPLAELSVASFRFQMLERSSEQGRDWKNRIADPINAQVGIDATRKPRLCGRAGGGPIGLGLIRRKRCRRQR